MSQKVMPCEVYSRVVGYHRPVHNWNSGKQQEFKDRVCFSEEKAIKTGEVKAANQIAAIQTTD